jgi:hypothetical protein
MSNAVPYDVKKIFNDYFVKSQTAGVKVKDIIAKADVMYFPFVNNSNDSFRNIAKNAHHGTIEGSGLIFDPYWGWSNPAGTGYIDTHYNPATQGVRYTLNDAGIFACIDDQSIHSIVDEQAICGSTTGGVNRSLLAIAVTSTAHALYYALNRNDGQDSVGSIPFKNGSILTRRTASNANAIVNQNISTSTASTVSASIPNKNFFIFKNNGSSLSAFTGTINFFYAGKSLTDSEYTALNNAVNDTLIQLLFYKYGASNWGVQMAKSYFLTLHNFEKYEAWEVYEFIKRMQSDYVDGATTGYYYNTFGPSGQNKTVCDFIIMFKAGGNLSSNAWSKTGATLRWNQSGAITSSNTMPAYTRETNLGIVTVSSTDGWNGVTGINMNQTGSSVNSYYGNFPNFHRLKTTGTKIAFTGHSNRYKYQTDSGFINTYRGFVAYNTYPGWGRVDVTHLLGGSFNADVYFTSVLKEQAFIGDVSQFTNEYTGMNLYFVAGVTLRQDTLIGTLANLSIPDTILVISCNYVGITGGTSVWNRKIISFSFVGCRWTTQAIVDQLTIIKNQLAITPPTGNLSCSFQTAPMGIVPSNHQVILDIAAQHVAQSKTFTCTTRTS